VYLYRQMITKSIVIIPTLILLLLFISPLSGILSYFVLVIWALTGRQQAIQALFMSWMIATINLGLKPDDLLNSSGRYLVILAASISVFIHFRGKVKYNVFLTFLLGIFFIVHSIFISPFPDVSILKSVVFIVTFVILLSAWNSLNLLQKKQTELFIFGNMAIILLISLIFVTSEVGYLRNGSGFQGILNHPQSFGPFVALFLAWFIAQFLITRNRLFWYFALISIGVFSILASESRTALGALLLGTLIPLLFILLIYRSNTLKILPRLGSKFFLVTFFMLSIIFNVFFLDQFKSFLYKSNNIQGIERSSSDILSSLKLSRKDFVNSMLENIKENPVGGIGFGIASSQNEMKIYRDPIFGLPIGAPVEKGVLPIAIIEELGFLGAVLTLGWFVMIFRQAGRAGLASIFVLTTCIMINLGENIFFSTGGMGFLVIILTTWSMTPKPSN
jgi:hypothetical protein